jgi:hypothetical protein
VSRSHDLSSFQSRFRLPDSSVNRLTFRTLSHCRISASATQPILDSLTVEESVPATCTPLRGAPVRFEHQKHICLPSHLKPLSIVHEHGRSLTSELYDVPHMHATYPTRDTILLTFVRIYNQDRITRTHLTPFCRALKIGKALELGHKPRSVRY